MMSEQQQTWMQVVGHVAPQFNEIAGRNKLVTWAEESQFAIQAIQKNDKLAQCIPRTVQNAVINVAAVGLTLNPALGYAYLVPEGVKQSGGQYAQECMLRVSFKGLMKIATDSGSIKWCKAEVVKEKDSFEYNGPCSMPKHSMQPFSDRGKTVGVYCVAKTHEGDYLVDLIDAAELEKIKGAAKTQYVWEAWPDEMKKKAVIKRASKQWPKTDRDNRLDLAVAAVNELEGSDDMPHEKDITPKETQPRQKENITDERLEKAIDRINAGEFTVEKLIARFDLTDDQHHRVVDEVKVTEGEQ